MKASQSEVCVCVWTVAEWSLPAGCVTVSGWWMRALSSVCCVDCWLELTDVSPVHRSQTDHRSDHIRQPQSLMTYNAAMILMCVKPLLHVKHIFSLANLLGHEKLSSCSTLLYSTILCCTIVCCTVLWCGVVYSMLCTLLCCIMIQRPALGGWQSALTHWLTEYNNYTDSGWWAAVHCLCTLLCSVHTYTHTYTYSCYCHLASS